MTSHDFEQTALHWRQIESFDTSIINEIADRVHTSLPERPEVFDEKIRLYPDGCLVLCDGDVVVGYGIAHPWILDNIPILDSFLSKIPGNADCIYIHDVAMLPQARGSGSANQYVSHIKQLARMSGIQSLALVSVYGTGRVWGRMGFEERYFEGLDNKLKSYGESSMYMIAQV